MTPQATPRATSPATRPGTAPSGEELVELEPPAPAVVAANRAKVIVDLDREVALIDRATTALASGDPRRAITTIRLYVTETAGRGQLAEEAAAIDVEATCTARLPSATRKLAAFVAAFPQSSQVARLTEGCR